MIQILIREMIPDRIQILEARNGKEGLRLFRKERQNLSLVMLDFWLPKASGWDIFHLLEPDPGFQRYIPLVVMADRREEVAQKIPQALQFACAILEKPFEKKDLFEAIKLSLKG